MRKHSAPAAGSLPAEFLKHLGTPRNGGRLEPADGEGRAQNPACGDELVLTVRVRDGRVREARFEALGCAATLAAASAVTELLDGCDVRTVAEAVAPERIALALGGLPATRRHAARLASEAAVLAVRAACGLG